MKKIVLMFLLFNASNLFADPHYVQALHPYWGNDDRFLEFLNEYKEPVNVVVKKYEGSKDPDYGEDVYIYIYIINKPGSDMFSLSILCPGAEPYPFYSRYEGFEEGDIAEIKSFSSDPVKKNPDAYLDNNKNLVWKLDPKSGAQGMWVYSGSPPVKRKYQVKVGDGSKITGEIDGPSCAE